MSLVAREGASPVPGYQLISFLGKGGIGEVWRARGPGGVVVALKFITLGYRQGLKEWRAVQRIKSIRHPNLLPITGVWLLDENGQVLDDATIDQLAEQLTRSKLVGDTLQVRSSVKPHMLLVAMTLGDQNLADRLRQCQAEGLTAVPVDELLNYMGEAAKAIDFLNSPHPELSGRAIRHCDIKPQNMLLSGGAVQVCDFGLARLVGDARTTNRMEGTVGYVAPESIEGKDPTATTDEYSLAISYYELRTGNLPFGDDASVISVLMKHKEGRLVLTDLPEAEQKVIRRATSVDPQQRYESTQAMVAALAECQLPEPPPPRRGNRAVWVSTCLLFLLLIGGGLFAYWHRAPPCNVLDRLPNFQASPSATLVSYGGCVYPDHIQRMVGHDEAVEFVLIGAMQQQQPFYIMRNKVSNQLFQLYADREGDKLKGSQWTLGARAAGHDLGASDHPKLPVMRVTVEEAIGFAKWLGGAQGNLPTTQQWDTAAGLPLKPGSPGDGPFIRPGKPPGVAVNRAKEGPLPCGQAELDKCSSGCQDMAGNGREFTRNVLGEGTKFVPLAHPTALDLVILRGRSYAFPADAPLTYEAMEDETQLEAQRYSEAHWETGFRIVVEP